MRRGIKRSFICTVLAALCFISAFSVYGAENRELLDGIYEYEVGVFGADDIQGWVDTDLAARAGQSAEWYIFAIAQDQEEIDFEGYFSALKSVTEEKDSFSSVERMRISLAMIAVGAREDNFIVSTLEEHTGKQGVMSFVFGLHLINNGIKSETFTAEGISAELISLQGEDGGWSLDGKSSDVDITAMVLQALAPNKDIEGVTEASVKAFTFLEEAMLPDGEFASYGVKNAESAAQVILALTSWGRDPENETAFMREGKTLTDVLLGYRLSDGSFSHQKDGGSSRIATAQSACAIVSVERLKNGESAFFVMDAPLTEYEIKTEKNFEPGYKFWVCIFIAVLVVGGTVVVLAMKKTKKNILFIAVCGVIAVCIVLFTDISSEKDYFSSEREKTNQIGVVSIEIDCSVVAGRAYHIPEDGCILHKTEIELYEGDTVYDILAEALKAEGLLFESQGKTYIVAISNIGERQFGDLSGWVYYVNGERPSVGCGEYLLSDGDEIIWVYSLELGKDIDVEEK